MAAYPVVPTSLANCGDTSDPDHTTVAAPQSAQDAAVAQLPVAHQNVSRIALLVGRPDAILYKKILIFFLLLRI